MLQTRKNFTTICYINNVFWILVQIKFFLDIKCECLCLICMLPLYSVVLCWPWRFHQKLWHFRQWWNESICWKAGEESSGCSACTTTHVWQRSCTGGGHNSHGSCPSVWKFAFTTATAEAGIVSRQHDGINPLRYSIMKSHGDYKVKVCHVLSTGFIYPNYAWWHVGCCSAGHGTT